jgi:simple sugar transport system permease protein
LTQYHLTTSAAAPASAPAGAVTGPHNDERIAHRGPLRRWLISPEIGALIGAVVVWLFLWGNGETFGTAGTTLNWLDVAAPYGIMGTAIALLMIGGEFDLSSGVMTGAAAMIIGLFSRFYMGNGVHIGFAILVAFLAMPAVGLFNGVMVNRTGLPSFIITLASFYVGRGMMLVLSKRLASTVYVDQIRDQRGAAGFGTWIAHEWQLRDFALRDPLFVTSLFVGGFLFIAGLLEQSLLRRREGLSVPGLTLFLGGVVATLVGFFALGATDGVGANIGFGVLMGGGAIAAILGAAMARFVPATDHVRADRITGPISATARNLLLAGVGSVVTACLTPLVLSRNERRAVLTWAPSPIRPIIALLGAAIGVGIATRVLLPKYRGRPTTGSLVWLIVATAYAALLAGTLTVIALQLTTVQALRAIVMTTFAGAAVVAFLVARRQGSRPLMLICSLLAAATLLIVAVVARSDSSATRFHTVLPTLLAAAATALIANALIETLLTKRTSADPSADRMGRWLQVIGGTIVVAGSIVRLIYSNYTKAEALKLEAAGEPVPQNVLRQTVLWWILVAGIGAYILTKTKWGNWTFAVGGNRDASRAVGVPAAGVKVGLFMVVSLCAALSGTLIGLRYGTVQADQGTGLELEYIIGAVVGGCLMTGGYGTVIGASLGAAILAMSTLGFQTVAGWNGDARYAFLGGVLLVAVLVNTYIRKKAGEAR